MVFFPIFHLKEHEKRLAQLRKNEPSEKFCLFDEKTMSNLEYEQEKQEEKKKFEKQFTMYLDHESKTIPWYAQQETQKLDERKK